MVDAGPRPAAHAHGELYSRPVDTTDASAEGRGSSGRRRATRLLATVAEMHKRGYQGLRIVPLLDPEPFAWDCALVVPNRVASPGYGSYTPPDMGSSVPYWSRDGGSGYLWSSRPGSSARQLADQLEEGSLSGWLQSARLDDFAYAGWFLLLLGKAEQGLLPYTNPDGETLADNRPVPLFAWPDGAVPRADGTLPPAPLPWARPPVLIGCPDPDGPLEQIGRFALSYDGYGRMGRDGVRLLQVIRPVIRAVQKDGTVPGWAGLDVLRGALFFLQRQAHHTEISHPVNEPEMRAVTRQIVLHADGQPLTDDQCGQDSYLQDPITAGFYRRDRAAAAPAP